jgi:hypothetical protein
MITNYPKRGDEMKYCADCKKLVEEGIKTETVTGEYWGMKFRDTVQIPCCAECGSEDIEDPNKCPCGEEIPPLDKLCENCQDNLNDIKKEIRALFPKIKPIDESTVEEYILENLWEG